MDEKTCDFDVKGHRCGVKAVGTHPYMWGMQACAVHQKVAFCIARVDERGYETYCMKQISPDDAERGETCCEEHRTCALK